MTGETLRVERHGAITVCHLNRPERMNALTRPMLGELERFWLAYDADPCQRVAIITGEGDRAFCAGADLEGMAAGSARHLSGDYHVANRFTPMQLGIAKPTICAVNGVCAGGGLHFVTDCDFTIAAAGATFVDPHVSVGQVSALEPIGLARRAPLGAVLRMVLLGRSERLDAPTALRLGIVTEVVPDDQLLPRAMTLAAAIAANSPAAIAASRRAIWGSLEDDLEAAYRKGWGLLRDHADHHPDAIEGARAFTERREPDWSTLP